MKHYQRLTNLQHRGKGIFYAFSEKQFEEGMKSNGYTDISQLKTDRLGGYGSAEAFDNRNKFYERIFTIIAKWCTPEEVFEYEAQNYECSYTGDYTAAAEMVLSYWGNKKTALRLAGYGYYIEPELLNKYISKEEVTCQK
jgi:hypothetical protein